METIEIIPQNVCSRKMIIHHENGIIKEVEIVGGCDGNTHAIAKLLVGLTLEEASDRMANITCRGSRTGLTSCPNEMSKGIKEYLNK